MARQDLRIDGVPTEIKTQLRAAALKKFGKANAAMMVRHFITEGLAKTATSTNKEPAQEPDAKIRVQVSVPASMAKAIDERATQRLTSKSVFFQAIVNEHFEKAPLLGDDLSELRKSNYELSKIGINLNQIAKALNSTGYLSKEFITESNKRINSIRPEVRKHINIVLGLLQSKEVIFNTSREGKKKNKIKKV
jgi:Bacterial mobilisation protein (MobC)